ncbi:MAG TPA: hypothetical protein VFA49_06455 [Chloroflexota bacterium]|jgi:hypothetical protein|nr:hypothetical protein [Chloroflexota bacterium]
MAATGETIQVAHPGRAGPLEARVVLTEPCAYTFDDDPSWYVVERRCREEM